MWVYVYVYSYTFNLENLEILDQNWSFQNCRWFTKKYKTRQYAD